ncbi:Hypothetical predicted protein [Cloeon dipterum]|uniref:Uncharacterized protein n=1 Tax=Cloeon dipterum TaxID=197152 RepID=A0A8S1BTG7_9INSE|nr:Hypothetical predicted protein [Cloeon dipterum]
MTDAEAPLALLPPQAAPAEATPVLAPAAEKPISKPAEPVKTETPPVNGTESKPEPPPPAPADPPPTTNHTPKVEAAAPEPPAPTPPKETPPPPALAKEKEPTPVKEVKEAPAPVAPKEQPAKEQPVKEQPVKEQSAKEQPAKEPPAPKANNKRKREAKPAPDTTGEQRSKRNRTRTQPYQAPLTTADLGLKPTPKRPKSPDDKLVVFFKNEFLGVRNAEGSFYVCQATHNITKKSHKIRIRWLSQDKSDTEVYSPDFYDNTDFDCILTSLNLDRVDKNKFRLPKEEYNRIKSILDRALAVEKGSERPEVSESHPDGLDLSLFTDQAQLKKKRQKEQNDNTSPKRKGKKSADSSSSSESESDSSEEESGSSETSSEEEDVKPSKQTKPPVKKETAAESRAARAAKRQSSEGEATPAAKRPRPSTSKAATPAKKEAKGVAPMSAYSNCCEWESREPPQPVCLALAEPPLVLGELFANKKEYKPTLRTPLDPKEGCSPSGV